MKKKKATETHLYYEIEKVIIYNQKGATVILQSGSPTPPPKPPGGNG